MGRTNARTVSEHLIAHGLPADTPAAAIVNGTRPDQKTIVTTLDRLPEHVDTLALAAPTLLVIGRVVSLAHVLSWYSPDAAEEKSNPETVS
jgi:siroheme synthase